MSMSDTCLIQEVYKDTPLEPFLDLTRERHAGYCQRHDIEYRALANPAPDDWKPKVGHWSYVRLVFDALNEGFEGF